MKNLNYSLVIFSCLIIFPALVQSQIVIIDPPSISFQQQESTMEYGANNPVLVKVHSEIPWAVTCSAEPLIHESTGNQIPTDQIFMKHDLVDDFLPLNTTIDLGNGEPTGGLEVIINTLRFQISTTGQENLGVYHGTVRFFINSAEIAQLLLELTIESHLDMSLSSETVNFTTNIPGPYSGDARIVLMIESNTDNWHVEATVSPTSPTEYFTGENVFVKSSISGENLIDEGAGAGFLALKNHPAVLSGAQVGNGGATELEFRIMTDWIIRTGDYHFTVELKVPEIGYTEQINLYVLVQEYNIFSLSESGVYFHANGPPAIWEGDKAVKMTVGSNCGSWTVISEATNLESPDDMIPNSRLFMQIEPDDFSGNEGAGVGYYKLDTAVEVAAGWQTPPKEVCEMRFKLQTLDIDRPGHYEGIITFTHLIKP